MSKSPQHSDDNIGSSKKIEEVSPVNTEAKGLSNKSQTLVWNILNQSWWTFVAKEDWAIEFAPEKLGLQIIDQHWWNFEIGEDWKINFTPNEDTDIKDFVPSHGFVPEEYNYSVEVEGWKKSSHKVTVNLIINDIK